MRIDSVGFFDDLAKRMNANPDRFRPLGEAYIDCVLVMRGTEPCDFAVRLVFDGIGCDHVVVVDADAPAEFHLVGDIAAWRAMFDDIIEHGRATGLQTLNSLALMGGSIDCIGSDPMGLDKFSRFNQTLQEFFDGASQVAVGATTVTA